ncbi:MAG: hypothetical protein AAF493_30150 [Pseudomonadota bacterium]
MDDENEALAPLDGRNITAEQYVSLVTSHRPIVRLNRIPAPIHRLKDKETGEEYWIRESEVYGP